MKPHNIINEKKERIRPTCRVKYPHKLNLGEGSTINDFCWINARFGIDVGENTLIGPGVVMQTVNHVIKHIDIEQNANGPGSWCEDDTLRRIKGDPIKIGGDVWIGANVVVLPGVVIPDKCVIAAGTVVTKSQSKMLRRGDIVGNDVGLCFLGNRRSYE